MRIAEFRLAAGTHKQILKKGDGLDFLRFFIELLCSGMPRKASIDAPRALRQIYPVEHP
jgi:hypothetical protein